MAGSAIEDLGKIPWDTAVTENIQTADLPLLEKSGIPGLIAIIQSLDELELKIGLIEELIWHGDAPRAAQLARELAQLDKRYIKWLQTGLQHLGDESWGQKLLNGDQEKTDWYKKSD